MAKPLLSSVVEEMDTPVEGLVAYINRRSGELYTLPDPESGFVALGEDDLEPEDAAKLQEIEESDDWLTLPDKHDIHEYRIMEDFCRTIEDENLRELLVVAISGKGAFGRFKDVIARKGLRDRWYEFRDAALTQIAADWLEAQGIEYVDDRKFPTRE